jgi:Bacterial regulatory proteins, tetR family
VSNDSGKDKDEAKKRKLWMVAMARCTLNLPIDLSFGKEMARVGGPNAVILREATRQAGVSPNAAYRHFTNQAELLDAVRSACLSQLAAAIEDEMKKCRPGRDPQAFARKSLRAVGWAIWDSQ